MEIDQPDKILQRGCDFFAFRVFPLNNAGLANAKEKRLDKGHMKINQGDIYWIQLEEPDALEQGIAHPYVVVQEDVFNHSRIDSLVVCALTTNIKQAKSPGNVLLEQGEANLLKQSVVVVSKITVIKKTQLGEYVGSLTNQRIDQVLAGIRFLQLMTDHKESVEKK